MADLMITEAMKQTVITRLATINSAISILNLTNGKPAKVTVDEVLDLAERIERWAWLDLLGEERRDAWAPEKPTDPSLPVPPAKPALGKAEGAEPEPATGKGDRPQPTLAQPRSNGYGQRPGSADPKKISAIFGVGRSKGYSINEIKGWVQQKCGKSIDELTDREASRLIDDLRAL